MTLKTALLLIPMLLVLTVCPGQNIDELERRNGFKEIRLGMHVDSIPAEIKLRKEFLELDEFPAKHWTLAAPDLASIGEIAVSEVAIDTYRDRIYQIRVRTDKDARLMKALESVYGPSAYDMKNQTYFWKGRTLILKFRSSARKELELLFTSYTILAEMQADKQKKVEDIADDF